MCVYTDCVVRVSVAFLRRLIDSLLSNEAQCTNYCNSGAKLNEFTS